MLKVVEVMPNHFALLLDTETEKQLKEFAAKRGLNAVQALRVLLDEGLLEVCTESKPPFVNR